MSNTPPPSTTPDAAVSPWVIARRLGPASVLGLFASVAPIAGSVVLFVSIASISAWLHSLNSLGVFVYAGAFAVLSGLSLLPTYAQAALGGFVFGVAWGIPAALLGFVGGAAIAYEIARLASGDRVDRLLQEHRKWQVVRDALLGEGFLKTLGIISLLRLPPNSPFAITNLVLSALKVPRSAYLLGTLLGMTPRTAAAVIIGAGVNEFTKDTVDKAVPQWLWYAGIALIIVVIYIVGTIADRALQRATSSEPAESA